MITVEDNGDELYVVDGEKNEVTIQLTEWEPGGSPRKIGRRVDETIAGSASELQFPEAAVCIESEGDDQWTVFANEIGPYELSHDNHLVQIEANITIYIRFSTSATIRRKARGKEVIVDLGELTPLTIGFKSKVQLPIGEITVNPTLEGVAIGISNLSAAIETTNPDRSYPSLRGYPPLIKFGEDQVIPKEIQRDLPETGILLQLPDKLPYLLVASPLVYYLQASVDIDSKYRPRLLIPDMEYEYPLDIFPSFQYQIANTLRRVFFLDCLVRGAGPYGANMEDSSLLEDINFDAEELYYTNPRYRLSKYLEANFEKIESKLPEWHLSTFIKPEISHITSVPHILNRLSLIFLPNGTPLTREQLLERSLEEDQLSKGEVRGNMYCSQPIKPGSRPGQIHGWMTEGAPIDAFKILPEAFENRFRFTDENDGQKDITVVINDMDMDKEQTIVEDIYKDRAEKLSINVEIKQELTKGELLSVFEEPRDFVHYIGHCDNGGFRCSNGDLSIGVLDESNVRTFFLNACGSYREGLELLKKGSVAGAVTLQRVLDEQATQVGIAFARLIIHGFSVEQALRLARRQAVMSKAYICVGDGTYTLSQYEAKYPMYISIENVGGELSSTSMMCTQSGFGAIYQSYLNKNKNYLIGMQDTVNVGKMELIDYLNKTDGPIVYNGNLYWSTVLRKKIQEGDLSL